MYTRTLTFDKTMRESVFLLGPRGTGKTNWLKTHFPNSMYFDLLHSETYQELLANPSVLESRIPSNYNDWIIIDEIQKIPELLNEVHRLIEHKQHRFILTGSSARSLRRKGVNLLAGRALSFHMHPLTTYELGNKFDLSYALKYGLLPAVYGTKQQLHYLKTYIQLYLKEEVQQEALVRNLALFTRFLNTASFSQGEILSYTEIAREIGSNRQTVSGFFEILDDLLIAMRLPVFTKRAKRDVITHPKFYYFDVGVFNILRPKGPMDSTAEIEGPALETLFLQQARALNDYYQLEYAFFYWRTRSQAEVDFVFYGENGFHAFEIKRKTNLTAKDFNGLRLFKEDYPEATCHMLYGGTREYYDNDIKVMPFETALKSLLEILQNPRLL